MGDDGWLLEDGPKWCSILVSTTEVRTTLLFYIYGSWVSKRILILRDRIPNCGYLQFMESLCPTSLLQEKGPKAAKENIRGS